MLKALLKPTKKKRLLFFLLVDSLTFIVSLYLAILFRFDFGFPEHYSVAFRTWLVALLSAKLLTLWLVGAYRVNWRFIGIKDLFKVVVSLSAIAFVAFVFNLYFQRIGAIYSLPKSVILMDYLISALLVSFFRISKRVYLEILQGQKGGKKVLILGAGSTGERIARELLSRQDYLPVCFLDDDELKVGTNIHGIPVFGKLSDLKRAVKECGIEGVIIAIPSLSHRKVREIFESLASMGVKDIKIVPPIEKMPSEAISVKDLKSLSIEDLLSREVVKIEESDVLEFLRDKVILVSGAGGSIGSELVRQLMSFSPKEIIALEIDETELFNLEQELKGKLGYTKLKPAVADVRDREKLERVFKETNPDIVFHAAAYKHVPFMEFFPEEAIKTNVIGTYNIATLSERCGVEKFINISTDKAVKPKSVMGMSKRLAELLCISMNGNGSTKFISVRFGNVLGSRGSVIPIFIEQIRKGGPVTITHPDMERFFMTVSEAVLLVIQAAAMGEGGEIFVLDMGEPVKILKLAEELIRLQGLEPYRDIEIVFTGLRPGEKLSEELVSDTEKLSRTEHPKIFKVAVGSPGVKNDGLIDMIRELLSGDGESIKENLRRLLNKLDS